MRRLTENLEVIAEHIRQSFIAKDEAREKSLPLSREVIRHCSNAIKSIHRQEFAEAKQVLDLARKLLAEVDQVIGNGNNHFNIGFFRDAQKEFAEGSITLALVSGNPIPAPEELSVDPAAYLNGMGEAVGEIRRYLLDGMRKGDLSRGEELLSAMDDIYGVLVTMDFPDAITGGLRHTTDNVRSILERTRSDLTLGIRQMELEKRISSVSTKEKEDKCP